MTIKYNSYIRLAHIFHVIEVIFIMKKINNNYRAENLNRNRNDLIQKMKESPMPNLDWSRDKL